MENDEERVKKVKSHTGKKFGSYVVEEYGARAFSLGFSALTGS
jgi:erythromycin esterase-like protein